MGDKTIKVIFKEGWETMYSNDLTQGDYGQVLKIEGLSLPDGNVEVHFSLTEHTGEAPISIGSVKNNVITVNIPDFILAKENTYNSSYEAYAWIYVTDGESGRTIRKIVFTIDTRAEPTTNVPEDQKDKFLQEVRQVMSETKDIAQSVRDDANNGKFSGIPGEKGDNGKSAYEYAQEGGFEGTEEEFTELIAQAGQVDLSGYVTKEEHEAELLKTVIKTTTEPSLFHHITDSANMKVLDFGMEGITEQKTTSGKNFYSGGNISGTGNSWKKSISTIPAGTYMVTANVSSSDTDHDSRLILFYYEDGSSVGCYLYNGTRAKREVTFSKNVNGIICYASNNSANSTDDTFSFTDIQIEPGEVATEYEPFTNGPSPNPDYPQEIKNVGKYNEETGRYEHRNWVCAKNLVDEDGWKMGYPQISGIGKKVSFSTNAIGRYQIIDIPPNTMIYARLNVKEQSTTLLRAIFCVLDENNIVSAYYNDSSAGDGSKYDINSGNGCKFVISILDTLPENAKIWVNLVELSAFDGYYTSQQFTLTSPVPITKWDKLVKRDGVWGWSVFAKEYNLSADEVSVSSNSGCNASGLRIYIKNINGKKNSDSYCNLIRTSKNQGYAGNGGFIYDTQFCFYAKTSWLKPYGYIYDENKAQYTLANTALVELIRAAGGIQVWVDMQEEQAFHPLPDEEQTLLNNLETYYGVTNVYNEQGCPMWLTYVNDTKLYVDKKLLEIQQAMI